MNLNELKIACLRKGKSITRMLADLHISRAKFYRHVKKAAMPIDMVKKISAYLELTVDEQQVIFF